MNNTNGINAVMQNLLENAFLNVVITTPMVLSGACERLIGKGTTARCVDAQDGNVEVAVTSKGETMRIVFVTEPARKEAKERRVASVELY